MLSQDWVINHLMPLIGSSSFPASLPFSSLLLPRILLPNTKEAPKTNTWVTQDKLGGGVYLSHSWS